MRFNQINTESSRRFSLHRANVARWSAAVALLVVSAMPAAGRAQDATIVNRASAVFDAAGVQGTASAEVAVSIRRTAAVRLVSSQNIDAQPGQQRVFSHTLTNMGNANDDFRLEVSAPAGWTYQLYMDLDGDGVLGPADKLVSGALSLERGASVALLLVVTVPANAADATEYIIDIRALSTNDASISDSVRDKIMVRKPVTAAFFSIIKNVSSTEAAPGDTLTYTLSYTNNGNAASSDNTISDLLPSGLRFISGSIRLDGVAITDGIDADAGSVDRTSEGRDKIDIRIANILPGASGLITLKAVVIANANMVVTNIATMKSGETSIESTAAKTTITIPQLKLTKDLVTSAEIFSGDSASYRITWTNASTLTSIRNAVLTDTIPAPLEFVSAEGNASVSGRIVTWNLGTLAPLQAGSFILRTRASKQLDGEIVNRAVLNATNAPTVTASAHYIRVIAVTGRKLEVEKRAGVLEAALGDAIPYIVTVRNAGVGSLSNIVISDRLPEGVEFVKDRLTGADSARATGRDVTLWIAGPLAPREERSIRYVVSLIAPGSASSLSNLVTAEAENGLVQSDTASATVQIRRGFAMQSRTLLGKVWLDLDDDAVQDEGEQGVPGVEIWSEDGEVVITDSEGRYSFRNLRLGSHAFRLDTLGLPAAARLAKNVEVISRIRMDGWTTPRADFRIVPTNSETRVASTSMIVSPREAESILPVRRTEADTTAVTPVRVAPLRTEADRASEAAQSFVKGQVVRFFAPADGMVISTNRMFVGVEGEPGAIVRLYSGTSLVSEGELRPDGKFDFINVEVPIGPSHFRVEMKNSFSNEMRDSVSVHRTGGVSKFAIEGSVANLRAESQDIETVKVRVMDVWGVPVPGAVITVNSPDAAITASDNDRTSVGIQLMTNADGILRVPVRAGHRVGSTTMELATGKKQGRVDLRILPSVRSFIAAGAGQIGIGAAPQNFAALTMKGALGKESSVSVSYDSRRGTAEDDFFGRGYDPLDEGRYPAIGDASDRRILSASTQRLSAKVEHGFDWVEMGDIETGDFGGQGKLATYARSLTGVGAKVSTGALTWRAFGSLTDQVLSQVQVRGNGSSGPYIFGKGIRPGTDKIAVEVRSADNASIVIAREELQRFRDYQVDYSSGEVLLQRPLTATDPSGNPLFLVAVLELKSGGESRMITGGRLDLDASRLFNTRVSDSARVFVLGVRDGGENTGVIRRNDLVGGGFRFQKNRFHAGGEMLRVASFDSSVIASRAVAGVVLPNDKGGIEAEWTKVGAGFVPGLDPRLSGASEDLRVTGTLRLSDNSTIRITDSRQKFEAFGVERHSTIAGTSGTILGKQVTSEGSLANDRMGLDAQRTSSSFMSGKIKVGLSQKASIWFEGSHTLATGGSALAAPRPDLIATGLSYEVFEGVHLESSQRWVGLGKDTSSYSVSSLKLRTESLFGGSVWAGVDHGAASSVATSATIGWKPRVAMNGGWSVDGMLERRFGLNRASLSDPLRALPFPQIEQDRVAYGLGTQWLPKDSVGRMSIAGEMRKDQLSSGQKLAFEAEAPMSETAAFMFRSEWWKESRNTGTEMQMSRRDRSLVAAALRPTSSNTFNVLSKVEWRRTANPGMGARFSGTGNNERLIAATDAIWGIRSGTEFAARYAVRMTVNNDPLVSDSTSSVRSLSHYVGGRFEQSLLGPLSARVDARMLRTGSGIQRWNAAPSALLTLGGRIDVEAGYRFGNLRDADFAAQGGKGFFATLGVRVTERSLSGVTGFWRDRLSSEGR